MRSQTILTLFCVCLSQLSLGQDIDQMIYMRLDSVFKKQNELLDTMKGNVESGILTDILFTRILK